MTYSSASPVTGRGGATAAQIDRWFALRGPEYAPSYAPDGTYKAAPPLGAAIVAISNTLGINADLVAAQVLHETAAWQSRYARERNNPGGLGAINSNPDLAIRFTTPAAGIRAHVSHLATYALGDGPWTVDDPRYADTPVGWRGAVKRLSDLDGKWAHPGIGYGSGIAKLANQLLTVEAGMSTPYESIIPGMVDLRGELQRNPSGGPNQRRSLDSVRGLVVHFNGPDVGSDDRAHIINVAKYHCTKDFSRAGDGSAIGDGIMYHVGVADDGTVYLQRDFEDQLWHCGNTEWNERSLSVYVPIGINQRATDAQLAALGRVVDGWRRFTEDGRELVKGHQELSPTNCPGSLMADFVLPYRAGDDTQPPVEDVPGAQPDPWRFDNPFGTDFWVLNPFVDWIHQRGGLLTTGYVRDGAFIEDGKLVQYFQRYRLEWHPQNAPANRVLGALLGQEEYQRRYPRGRTA